MRKKIAYRTKKKFLKTTISVHAYGQIIIMVYGFGSRAINSFLKDQIKFMDCYLILQFLISTKI